MYLLNLAAFSIYLNFLTGMQDNTHVETQVADTDAHPSRRHAVIFTPCWWLV